jgi:hypothetical protein
LARRYDFYLPLTFNDGRTIERHKFMALEETLMDRFQGITSQRREFPFQGIWQAEKRYYDDVILIAVLDFRPRGSSQFVSRLKKQLLEDFDQLEILITETLLRVF